MTRPAQPPQRFAASAGKQPDDDVVETQEGDAEVDMLFEQWSAWCLTRRFFCPPPGLGNVLGRLRGPSRPSRQPPSADCDSFMAALNLAIGLENDSSLDARIFWVFYGKRAANIKQAAYVLGISRQHFYRRLRAFKKRVLIAAKKIEAANLTAGQALPHRADNK